MPSNLFSIIIPTMWKSQHLNKILNLCQKSNLVGEIILIDNDPKNKFNLPNYSKLIYYTENKNIYVNPAWNLGNTLSSNKIILANDDIVIENIDEVLDLINHSDYDIIGINPKKSNKLEIEKIDEFPSNGYGCFLYVKNYKYIPPIYKIWRGDFIQFQNAKKKGILRTPHIEGDLSLTVNNDSKLLSIAKNDSQIYKLKNQNNKKTNINVLFVLVNYGSEQITYLEKVVKEIKSFEKYNTTIIVNSNIDLYIEGIDKVNIFDNLSDYQLLPLTCRKTIFENKDNYDMFVYGENDHLFKEFHLDKHLEYSLILPENRISGLIQYEESKDGFKYYPAYFKNFEWDFNSVEIYDNLLFAHFSNVHQASFILTKKQLNKICQKNNFCEFFAKSNYSFKCKVNTDIYEFSGMKKVICISEFKENLIHHLPNLYINGDLGRNKKQSSDSQRMKNALVKLFGSKLVEYEYKLSVIIPTFDNLNFIQDCLNSVLNSINNLNCEILVGIDNCEKTLNYVKNQKFDNRIKFFYFCKNVGPYVIKNSLVKESNSDYILFFDSDDIMKEEMISKILYKLTNFDFIKPMYSDFIHGQKFNDEIKTNKYGEGVFAIKKSLFLEMNGFEPWRCAADSDFMGRLYKNNKKFSYTDNVVFHRRIHQNSLTQNPETSLWSKTRANYSKISKSKTNFGPLPELVVENFDIVYAKETIILEQNKFDSVVNKKDLILGKVMNIVKPSEEKKVDYEKINQVVQQKGVYTPQKNIPIRENKPNDRNELIKLKNGQNNQQLEKLFKGKPNRRNGLPNIF